VWVSFGAAASAQSTGISIDAGALSMQYADSIESSAIAITPSLWADSRLTSLSMTGTLSEFTTGGWSAQGSADASVFTNRRGLFLGELEGTGGGSSRNDGSRTGQVLGSARIHLATDNHGVWLGAGLGSTWYGATWRNVRQAEAAAWARLGALTAFASAIPVVIADSIRYTDAQAAASLSFPRFELSGSGGFRSGSRLPTLGGTAKSWGSASVSGWIAPWHALVASAGTYPVDLTQGFPGGRFASLSLRFGARRFPPAVTSVTEVSDIRSSAPAPPSAPGISSFDIIATAAGTRELRIRAVSAGSVEIMGDFTSWQPVSLNTAGTGWWTVRLPIMPGIHEMNVRVNGGPWVVPPGLTARSDEFGGKVGVLVVR
jgi:hypothetical protein